MAKKKHTMVDIETLSSRPNAVVASIGAAQFDPETGEVLDTFYRVLDVEEGEALGMDVSASTFLWWLSQGADAARALSNPTHKVGYKQGLTEFSSWWKNKSYFWGHTFDPQILRWSYDAVGVATPWHYRDTIDIRTVTMLTDQAVLEEIAGVKFEGAPHNALHDAIHQVKYCSKMYQSIKA